MHIKRYTKPATKLFNLISSDIGRPLLDITHHLTYSGFQDDMRKVFDTLQPIEQEIRGPDNRWYIARLMPYRTAEDHIEGLVLSFIDISMRKAVEEKLFASEQRMQLVASSTKDYAITTMDMDGLVTSWNSGAERLFGYLEKDILGQSAAKLFTPEDRANGVFEEELRQARQEGRAEDDRWHLRSNGLRVYCSGITSPLVDHEMRGYVKIARDLTGSKRLQDQQDAQLEWEKRERIRAEESARLRDEFFAVLSHELKQPLNLIQLTAEMLSRLSEPVPLSTIARGTTTIKRMVDSQARIIDDLMDLSRLHTGKLSLTRTQVNLTETVSSVIHLMGSEVQEKGIVLSLEAASRDLIVHGDAVRIEQIIWNLLSNAVKFTPAGGTVNVRLIQQDNIACMEVADTGKGISADFLPSIFDMFRQADTGTTRRFGGMGIGLALVKELVVSHGGRVEAHSEGEGRGAQFRIFLPLVVQRYATRKPAKTGSKGLTGKRILLVDDMPEMLDSLGDLLKSEGADVTLAPSGANALAIAKDTPSNYDLIISDIGMPDMDGYSLLAELRNLAATATTPAIALSGFTRPADVEHALKAGFETHVRKPVAIDQFISIVIRLSQ